MKIVILATSIPPHSMGGVGSAHYNLGKVLQKLGHDVSFVTVVDTVSTQPAPDEDLPTRRFSVSPRLAKLLRLCFRVLFRLIERGGSYQVANICLNQLNMSKASRAIEASHPDIVILPDHGAPAFRLRIPCQYRVIEIEHHNPARFVDDLHMGGKVCLTDVYWAVRLQQKALQRVHAVVCPSQYMKAVFGETYAFQGDVRVIPNVLDLSALQAIAPHSVAQQLGFPTDTPIVYIPSGGSPLKGERYVLAIANQILHAHPHVAFFISGPLSPQLRHELATSQIGARCYAPGVLPYADNLALAASCTLCLSPCLLESYGMALVEAMTLGLPAIAFNSGGTSDIVNEDCGALVNYLDTAGLVEAACQCLKDAALLRQKSTQARKRAEELQHVAELRWAELLQSLSQVETHHP